MKINKDDLENYKEALKWHGVPIEDFPEKEIKKMYMKHLDQLEMDVAYKEFMKNVQEKVGKKPTL